jgi:hypothetical protein
MVNPTFNVDGGAVAELHADRLEWESGRVRQSPVEVDHIRAALHCHRPGLNGGGT